MRRVEQIDASASDGRRDRNLFARRVMAGSFGHGAKVLSQLRCHPGVLRPAEEDVLRGPVDPGEAAEQIPEIRADAEIVELACVNRDSHAVSICWRGTAQGRPSLL
jgi:hypothetical protein